MSIFVDSKGFIHYGDFKLPCKFNFDTWEVEFADKDKRRSSERGTRIVKVPLARLMTLLMQPAGGREMKCPTCNKMRPAEMVVRKISENPERLAVHWRCLYCWTQWEAIQ